MAGRRRRAGKPKRAQLRLKNWRARIAGASTSEEFFDVASDWFRATCTHVPDAGRRTGLLNEAGQHLAGLADNLGKELTK